MIIEGKNGNNFCVKCGSKLSKNDVFCSKCGKRVKKSEEEIETEIVEVKEEQKENVEVEKPIVPVPSTELKNNTVCRYCKKEIDIGAVICPYCRKKLKGSAWNTLAWIFVIIIVIIGCGVAATMYESNDLVITSSKGGCTALGLAYFEGSIKNNGNYDARNVKITYTCYNGNREVVGKMATKIKYIKSGETLNFKAEGVASCGSDVSCEHRIDRYSDDDDF